MRFLVFCNHLLVFGESACFLVDVKASFPVDSKFEISRGFRNLSTFLAAVSIIRNTPEVFER